MGEIFNFSAGPGMLPIEVLNQIEAELRNWHNLKISIMEISHRSDEFYEIVYNSENDLRELLNISNTYKVLFCHGGARTQFSSIPMNLLRSSDCIVDYIDSGYWSRSAAKEAKKYCRLNLIDVNIIDKYNKRAIKSMRDWKLSSNSAYLHYCPNETVDGVAIYEVPKFNDSIVVGDLSSTLLSRPVDVNAFGIIYAAAQKNIGLPGLTIVIIRKDLLARSCYNQIPSTLQYSILSDSKSMFNTPPTFSWYVAGLIFKWIKGNGGLLAMNLRNKEKANLLYKIIDASDCYYNNIAKINRSYMNVPFYLYNEKLNDLFLKKSHDMGLYFLKGHISVGGMRASLYNAMPLKGVKVLVEFMEWFARKYG